MGFLQDLGNQLSGTSKDAGILGMGQYKTSPYEYNEDYFTDHSDSDKRRKEFAKALKQRQNVATPQAQAAQIATGPQNQFRAQQMGLAGQLAAQAAGQGPSLAQSQLRQATDRNIAQAAALAGSQRGMSAGQNLRGLMQSQAMANQQAAGQAADLRMQEQMAARQQLAGLTEAGRAQDIGLASNQAGLTQQASLANQQAALAAQAQKDAMAQYYGNQQVGLDQYDTNRLMSLEQLRGQQNLGVAGVNADAYQAAAQNRQGMIGGVAGALSTLSDEDQKKNVSQVESDSLSNFLSNGPSKLSSSPVNMSVGKPDTSVPMVADSATGYKDYLGDGEKKSNAYKMGEGLAKAGMAAYAASDEDEKKNINGYPKDKIENFVSALKAYEYEYKDPKAPGAGKGKFVSPMAQDIEKSELGKGMVMDTPEGKMVNYGKAGGLMLATAAMLNDKVSSLEEQLAKVMKKRRG